MLHGASSSSSQAYPSEAFELPRSRQRLDNDTFLASGSDTVLASGNLVKKQKTLATKQQETPAKKQEM